MMLVHKTVGDFPRVSRSDSGVKNGKGLCCVTQLLEGGCHLGIPTAQVDLARATGDAPEEQQRVT
jgi:hypothetical protein